MITRVRVDGVDRDLWTPLHYATAQEHQNIVKYLLEKGANPNAEGLYVCRPLYIYLILLLIVTVVNNLVFGGMCSGKLMK